MVLDYKKLGFKCGIEAHQQLETHKLFCSCPSIVHDKNPEIFFERKLRAAVGETGELDAAAKHEQGKGKKFLYEACPTSSCLVEFDEEPPHDVNKEALDIVLQVSKAMNCQIVDEVQFMRKTVVDGSNVSGFQRTALIGLNGYIETSLGKVGVANVCLEEEAAKKVETGKDYVKYRLDRLGVCLIEIGTEPDIKNPEHAKEAAKKIGMILRSTGKVKRGIGTIRQDVNVSIKGGTRVEVKGFQDLKSIPKVIDHEIKRQQDLIKKGKAVDKEVRKAEPDFTTSFMRPMPGAARMYPETDVQAIKISKKMVDGLSDIEMLDDKIEEIVKKYGVKESDAKELLKMGVDISKYKADAKVVCQIFIDIPKDVKAREQLDTTKLKLSDYEEIIGKIDEIGFNRDAIREIMIIKINGKKVDYSKYKAVDDKDIEKEIKAIVDKNKGAPFGALMGQVMAKFRGKVDGKKISEILKKLT